MSRKPHRGSAQPSRLTLRELLTRSLRVPAAFAVGASAVLWLGGSLLSGTSEAVQPESEVVAEQGAATPSLSAPHEREREHAALMRDHGCWSGEAPAALQGQLPGHVVVSHRRGREVVTTYAGEIWVGRALEQLFGDGDPRVVTVHGFCP